MGKNREQKLREAGGPLLAKAYRCWVAIRQRCSHPYRPGNECYYGVRVSPYFSTFEGFLECLGLPPTKEHQIDRINGEGDYEPGNVRWVLPFENRRNQKDIKLSREEAETIRTRYAQGGVSQQSLADEYGVSQSLISAIIIDKCWVN